MVSKNITNKELIHGDFDKDGVRNIDDRYPFNKKKEGRVNSEVSLSQVLMYIERKRREARIVAREIAKREDMTYRIKHSYSVIDKAVRRNPAVTNDFIGLREELKKRVHAEKEWKEFNKRHKIKKKDTDNKYKKPRADPIYRAYHSNLFIKGFGVEAQFRTKKLGKLIDKQHKVYKQKKKPSNKIIKKAKSLIKRGY